MPYPVGSIGYIGPKKSHYGKDGIHFGENKEHYKLYTVQQNPKNCKCRWQQVTEILTGKHHYYSQPNASMAINLNYKYPQGGKTMTYP